MSSQVCEEISPYKEGTQLEYTNYNKKGKKKSIEKHIIESVTNLNAELIIKIKSTIDKKGNPKSYTLKCNNGNFYIDMSNYTSLQNEDSKDNLQVKASGDFLEFPEALQNGDSLKDGLIDLQTGSQDSFTSVATMKVTNRKVLENNSFSLKAGIFNGYKISFDYVFNLGILKFRGTGVEWFRNSENRKLL